MKSYSQSVTLRLTLSAVMVVTLLAITVIWGTLNVSANHPVLVEGNCPGPASRTNVAPGTCGDYDGDGRIGIAEDTDEADRIFGTINAALGAGLIDGVSTGANQNGSVTIVTSGVFPEVVRITGANGNVVLQAAHGVEANIEAVLQGAPGNADRQEAPGIIVDSPANRYVVIRNITSRNWTSGIQVNGYSRVAIESCRFDGNIDYGIEVKDNAKVTITKAEVHNSGLRQGAPGTRTDTNPGKGIEFDDHSSGTVYFSTVSGSFAAGISNETGRRRNVLVRFSNVFDNNPDLDGVSPF